MFLLSKLFHKDKPIELYGLTQGAYQYYISKVKGNKGLSYLGCQKKLTRDILCGERKEIIMINSYRKYYNAYDYEDLEDSKPNDQFVSAEEVQVMLDEIESEVNNIKDLVEPIDGLSEIDEVYNKLKDLSEKLY
jgi:hypothetical protein